MVFYQIPAGGDRNFAYVLGDRDGGTAAVVDPPADAARYADVLERHDLTAAYAILTHGHGDHTGGVRAAVTRFGCRVVGHESIPIDVDVRVRDGDTLAVGDLTLRFIHTPGHTDDSICILCEGKLITGDTLFVGKVGGTDLGEGARREYDSLHGKLMTLPPETEVYPGHDYGTAPSSTIGRELETNPFILRDSFEAFVDLKANWTRYKREHGID